MFFGKQHAALMGQARPYAAFLLLRKQVGGCELAKEEVGRRSLSDVVCSGWAVTGQCDYAITRSYLCQRISL